MEGVNLDSWLTRAPLDPEGPEEITEEIEWDEYHSAHVCVGPETEVRGL